MHWLRDTPLSLVSHCRGTGIQAVSLAFIAAALIAACRPGQTTHIKQCTGWEIFNEFCRHPWDSEGRSSLTCLTLQGHRDQAVSLASIAAAAVYTAAG